MHSTTEFPARGTISRVGNGVVVFRPIDTTYQLHLQHAGDAPPQPSDRPVQAVIRMRARKVWTVPSGGLFISPIFGTPRIVQGRVRDLDEQHLVLNAGTNIVLELPNGDAAIDLSQGPIRVGTMVNATVMPGARLELLAPVTAV